MSMTKKEVCVRRAKGGVPNSQQHCFFVRAVARLPGGGRKARGRPFLSMRRVCISFILRVSRATSEVPRAHARMSSTPADPTSSTATATATSLAAALSAPRGTIKTLDLSGRAPSTDLTCINLMCEKVGEPCVCRLAGALEKLAGRGLVEVRVGVGVRKLVEEGRGVVPEGVRVVVVE